MQVEHLNYGSVPHETVMSGVANQIQNKSSPIYSFVDGGKVTTSGHRSTALFNPRMLRPTGSQWAILNTQLRTSS